MNQITTAKAATIIGVSQRHIGHLIRQGQLDATRINNRLYMVEEDAAKGFVRTRRGRPTKTQVV